MITEPEASVPVLGKETVEVYVRHLKSCRNKSAGKQHRKCGCPKYLYIYRQGKVRRVSAKTGSWTKAQEQADGDSAAVGPGAG